jgi:hypothetical protein
MGSIDGRPLGRIVWLAVGAVAMAFGCAACKRLNEGEHPQTLDPVSSPVAGNSTDQGVAAAMPSNAPASASSR